MGLIGGMARTAVVAGTATAVSNRVSRRQAERWSQQGSGYAPVQRVGYAQEEPPAAAPAPAEPPARDIAAQLTDLAQLKEQGVLTEQEFAAQKARVLGT
ncbi:MAG TPA: SHOCT domain-containing protein [Thermoleophilaceae bacterium]